MLDDPTCRQNLANNLVDLVALTIESAHPIPQSTAQHALRHRVQKYIRSHLTDTDLTPYRIAHESGVSLSYLYKIFQAIGQPVNEYIIDQRLQLAYEILTTFQGSRLTVAEVAYRSGFKSVPHFSRLFAKRFKAPPGRMRQVR